MQRLGKEQLHKLDGLKTHCNYLSNQPHNVLRIIIAIGVVGTAAALVGADLILIDDPIERGAIAQPILKHFGWNSTQS
jgi:hypothetical protein